MTQAPAPAPGSPDGASRCVGANGVWCEVLRDPADRHPQPALFVDRDGVLVEEIGHLRRAADVRVIPGAARAIATANRLGIPVVIVSNQSGVGRGLFGWADFAAVQARLLHEIEEAGARIDAVLACPHHAEAHPPYRHPDHPARKPNPGMLLAASAILPINLAASWIIGDRSGDLAAGRNAGLAGGLLVRSGVAAASAEIQAVQTLASRRYRVFVAPSIADAPTLLPLLHTPMTP